MLPFFIPSFIFKTEKYYDLVGSLTYVTTISLAYFSVDDATNNQLESLNNEFFLGLNIYIGK